MSKKLNILIKNYLLLHGEVIVPGLGRFKEEYIPSSLHVVSKSIKPSATKYSFDDSYFSDSGFIDYVCSILNISKNKAEDKIREFSEQVLNRLLNYRMAKLYGIGELKQKEDKTIEFVPDAILYQGMGTMLPTLQLNPIERGQAPKEEIILSKLEENKKYAEDFKSKAINDPNPSEVLNSVYTQSRWKDYMLCAILILAIVLLISQCSQLYKQNELRNRTYPVTNISEAQTDDSILDDQSEALSRKAESHHIDSRNTNTDDSEAMQGPVREIVYNYNLSEDIIEEGCIIVVGSYKNANNANTMIARIKKDGHRVFKEPNNIGYTRVGLFVDCNNDSDLPSILQNIRASYSDSSWYLSPELDVEY